MRNCEIQPRPSVRKTSRDGGIRTRDPLTPRHLHGRIYQRKLGADLRSQVRAYTRKSASVRTGCHSDSHSGVDPLPHHVGKHGGEEGGLDEGFRDPSLTFKRQSSDQGCPVW